MKLPMFDAKHPALALLFAFVLLFVPRLTFGASEITPKPPDLVGDWGDQGDGSFVNPILPADYSDLDAIRVGDDYYAISSTFQFSPGVVILHSKDLVHWSIIGHAVSDITQIGPEMNWDRMDRYGHGIWAGAIRYHAGKFWVYFGTPQEGFFMTTTTDPAGPWAPLTTVWKVTGWDDCCPFWDDDGQGGQGYFVCSNYSGGYKIHLFKMSPDGTRLLPESDKVIHQSRGSEANKLYKINGVYYHYYSEVRAEGRVAMMDRAKSLDGPWETHQLNHVNKALDKEPNQGGLIQLPSGEWWFLTHQGTGDWEGRAMVLLPVTWTDGWPIIGKVGADGIGNMVWQMKKPVESAVPIEDAPGVSQMSFDFKQPQLAPQWEWNYQPRSHMWSLTERPGFLRLYAFPPLTPGDLMKAGNTLTQRCIRTKSNEVNVKMDIGAMADGEEAGLCHFAKTWAMIEISQSGGVRRLSAKAGSVVASGLSISSNTSSVPVWLKSTWGFDGVSQFSYSLDGNTFVPLGNPYQLTWGNYRGDRVGIFNFNDKGANGYVDVESFHYRVATAN